MIELIPKQLKQKLPTELWMIIFDFIYPTEHIYKNSMDRFKQRRNLIESAFKKTSKLNVGPIYPYGMLTFSLSVATFSNGTNFYKTVHFGIDNAVTFVIFTINSEAFFMP